MASLSQGRTAAAQCGLFTYKSVPVIFEPPCNFYSLQVLEVHDGETQTLTMTLTLKYFYAVPLYLCASLNSSDIIAVLSRPSYN